MNWRGQTSLARQAEDAIRETGCFTMAHDGGQGAAGYPGRSSSFTRVYEVYPNKDALDILARKQYLELFYFRAIHVRIFYSYRDGVAFRAEIKVKDGDLKELCHFIPVLTSIFSNAGLPVEHPVVEVT